MPTDRATGHLTEGKLVTRQHIKILTRHEKGKRYDMKNFKKIMALIIACVMTIGMMSTMAFADGETAAANDGKITVTPPDGTQATSKNTYTLYKVFAAETDGSNYSYKLSGSHDTVPAGFILDDAGNVYFAEEVATGTEGAFTVKVGGTDKLIKNKPTLSQTDINAIASYVTTADKVDEKEVTGTTPAVFSGLSYGYYYVATTTGTLVVIDSTKPDVNVEDKNEVPPLTKKITQANSVLPDDTSTTDIDEAGKKAIAQVGTSVQYTLTVTKKKGAENYEVHDTMGTGLKYNKDVAVTVGGTAVDATKYTKTETDSSLVVKFDNTYMASLADDTVITLVYTALVTEDALHTVPAKNTAYLSYGHTPGENKTPTVETETYNAKFSVVKKDGKDQFLGGAGFVLKNSAGKYYKYTAATESAPEKVEWVDALTDATEYTSKSTDGTLDGEFTGLPNGTYTLVENTVPTGYNKAADYTFTVNGADVTDAFSASNLIQSTTVINNKGVELPSTGGVGTTIFYIIGGILILGAAIALISKKKFAR